MVAEFIVRIGMYQSAERAPIYHQPADECSKLRWVEDIDLEHSDWMRSDRSIEDFVYA
jgi:hypothetical protein